MGGMLFSRIAGAAITHATTFMEMERQRKQQRYEASVADANAASLRNQRDAVRQEGRIAQENLDKRKEALHRRYNQVQSGDIAALGAGNVDMTSGSAADALRGNADRYAEDVGDNAYAKSLARWETQNHADALNYQADRYNAQASYLKKTSGNLLTSWLGADLAAAGNFFGSGPVSFGSGGSGADARTRNEVVQPMGDALRRNIAFTQYARLR